MRPPKPAQDAAGDRVGRVRGQARVEHAAHPRVAVAGMRRWRRRSPMPARAAGAACGCRAAPARPSRGRASRPGRASARPARRSGSAGPAATPASTSEWPFRYLVAEWKTRSAPCSSGRQLIGVAIVLSTTSLAPAAWAISATAGMSATARCGFETVSTTTRAAPSTAVRSASRSPMSTSRPSGPGRGHVVGLAVDLRRRDEAGPGRRELGDGGGERAHPGGEAQARLGALELGDDGAPARRWTGCGCGCRGSRGCESRHDRRRTRRRPRTRGSPSGARARSRARREAPGPAGVDGRGGGRATGGVGHSRASTSVSEVIVSGPRGGRAAMDDAHVDARRPRADAVGLLGVADVQRPRRARRRARASARRKMPGSGFDEPAVAESKTWRDLDARRRERLAAASSPSSRPPPRRRRRVAAPRAAGRRRRRRGRRSRRSRSAAAAAGSASMPSSASTIAAQRVRSPASVAASAPSWQWSA